VYDYVAGKADWFAAGLPGEGDDAGTMRIGELAEPASACRPEETMGDLRQRLGDSDWELCPVVNEQKIVLGAIRPEALEHNSSTRVETIMDPAPSTFRPDVPAEQMRDWFSKHDLPSALVTTPEGKLAGVISVRRLEAELAAPQGAR
jgi:CBS domain-containing protein